jgi:hypothetical protein
LEQLARPDINGREGFIQQQKGRVNHKGAGKPGALTHSARQPVGDDLSELSQFNPVECRPDSLPPFLR